MKWKIIVSNEVKEIVEFDRIEEVFDYAEEKYSGKINVEWINDF